MHTHKIGTKKPFIIAFFALTLAACGGGGGDSLLDQLNNQSSSSGGSNNNSGGGNSSAPNTTVAQQIGYGSNTNFQQGVIGAGIGENPLSAGGDTTLTVNIVSSTGDLVTESVAVTFNSRCIAANSAALSVDGVAAKTVTTTTGEASVVYTAKGCVGEDRITATATIGGNSLTAQHTITVESDTVGSISFVDASPSLISLKGTGGNEASVVRFLVTGSTGAPVQGVCVSFELNTSMGGLTLGDSKCENSDPAGSKMAKTGPDGHASISVLAGTFATPVTVTARDIATQLSTQSKGLRVSTGIPDQKSMSLSASVKNPAGWEYDDEQVIFTILLADAFNNPPADGTVVSFTTSGGAIANSCTTENGKCTVNWRSQDPRPASGRVTVLAHTTGNESFQINDGDGWYDADKVIFAAASEDNPACFRNVPPSTASKRADACDDLGEAYLDANQNGVRDHGETVIDFNNDGQHTAIGDGIYNGILCRTEDIRSEANPNGTCTRSGVTIRQDYLIVMSSEHPRLNSDDRLIGQPLEITVGAGGASEMTVQLMDINGNPLPAGTQVKVNITEAENLSATPSSITIPSTTEPQAFTVRLRGTDETKAPNGFLYFEIIGPNGLTTTTAPTIAR